MLGVYIHIPFCKRKCEYCDFCSTSEYDGKLLDSYEKALICQLDDFFRKGGRYEIDTVYFGGGTPSVFGGKRISHVIDELKKRTVMKYAEVTVEVNPESCDKKLFKQLASAGVNRISIGVQSANENELKMLGRLHSFEKASEAVALCKKYCTTNISLDMMYGLENQTIEQVVSSLKEIIRLEPVHISCYGLKVEEGTPMHRKSPVLPDDEAQEEMYFSIIEQLSEAGFEQYEISNFAKKTFRSKHNSKYWDLSEYIGFGASAHSYYGGKRFSFTSDIKQYINGVLHGENVIDSADELVCDNRIGEYIMLKLRTCDGIDEDDFLRRFKCSFTEFSDRLCKYIGSGHVVCDSGIYRLTPKGFMVSNTIICDVLGEYL